MMKRALLFIIILFGTFGYRSGGMPHEINVDKEGGSACTVVSVDSISGQASEGEDFKEIEEQLKLYPTTV
jgi:hypothetical protein